MSRPGIATIAARAGVDCDAAFGAVMPPLHLSSNFSFAGFGQKRAYDYTRSGNPTRDLLARAIADLEHGECGLVTATGMAAITLVTTLLGANDTLVVPHDCYGGSYRLFVAQAARGSYRLEVIDFNDAAVLAATLSRKPKLVWIETPSNPLLRITDIASVSRLAHAAGALVVVDNTFLSPALQQPLLLGADIVVHSTTKYLNGHSDVVGGSVVCNDHALGEQLAWWCNCLGLAGAPFDSYLTLRGLRTLQPRLLVQQENTLALVQHLASHPSVRRVHFPGRATHPGHAVAARQQSGFGAMLSFELTDVASAAAFVTGLRYITLAESLGGVESLIAHPATMTHASMDAAARARAGIGDGLLRLSVGLETIKDLITDVDAGLARVAQTDSTSRAAVADRPNIARAVAAA